MSPVRRSPLRQASSSEEAVAEREALRVLVQSDGWRIFHDKVLLEWVGEGYFDRMAAALTSPHPHQPHAVHYAALEMKHLLSWPTARIGQLQGVVGE